MAVEQGAQRHARHLLIAALVVLAEPVSIGHTQDAGTGIGGLSGAGAADAATPDTQGGTSAGSPATGQSGETAKPGQPAPSQADGNALFPTGPGWIINVGATLSEIYTDRAALQTGSKIIINPSTNTPATVKTYSIQPDYITQINPYITIHGDTPRVTMDLYYSPSAWLYAEHGNMNGFSQNLNGRAHVVLAEDKAFMDVYAYGSLAPALGGYNYLSSLSGGVPSGGPGVPSQGIIPGQGDIRQSLSQVYSFGVTPYAIQRFGGWGTAKVGISGQYTNSGSAIYANGTGKPGQQPAANTQTLQETAEFTSGENLGRFQSRTNVSGQQSAGNGLSRNSSDYVAQTALTYAATRWASVFGQIGYEAISYGNVSSSKSSNTTYQNNNVIWSTGAKFTFGEDGYVTIGYGRRYGVDSVSFEGAYSLTARTRVTARYWTGFGTELQMLQADLYNTGIDQYGNTVNLDTSAPVFLGGYGLAGGNQNLYRSQNFNATLSSVIVDDPVYIGVQATDQTVVATTGTQTAFPNRSYSVNVGWSHSFSELMTGSIYGVYGKRDIQGLGTANSPINGTDTYILTGATLSYIFSPTLTGSARYSYYDQSSTVQFRSYIQNLVMISLTKQF